MLLGRIEAGEDPAFDRREARDAPTLVEFAARYLEEYSRPFRKPSSSAQDALNLRKHILPALGSMRVRDISRAHVAKIHFSMKGSPYGGNRCLALLSHMFRKAEAWGLRPDGSNPTRHVDKFPETARERFLSPTELGRLGSALADAGRSESLYAVAAIRLLVLTGARLGEVLMLEWGHVDFGSRLLRLPDSKMGKKTIALSAPALELLAGLPRQEGNPYVICGARAGARLINLQKPWRRIRKQAGLDDVRIHDLRHSYASVAVAGGASLPLIGALLGHAQPQTTARYAHRGADPRLAAADEIATKIDAAMKAGGRVSVARAQGASE